MSTSYYADIVIDGARTTETVRGLDRAKELAAELAQERGLRIVATDWFRDGDGVWQTNRRLAPGISVSLTPGRTVMIPQQRRESTWESRAC